MVKAIGSASQLVSQSHSQPANQTASQSNGRPSYLMNSIHVVREENSNEEDDVKEDDSWFSPQESQQFLSSLQNSLFKGHEEEHGEKDDWPELEARKQIKLKGTQTQWLWKL